MAHQVFRFANASDSPSIARLHAGSWRRHYRGMYSDRYLDGDLIAERMAAWTARLSQETEGRFTLLAEDAGRPIGFVHVVLDADATFGALIDNLHVAHECQGHGVGTRLLDRAAREVLARRPGSGIYLWVLEGNAPARDFYLSRKGVLRDSEPSAAPGNDPRNLEGSPQRVRVTWPDAALLLSRGGTPDQEPSAYFRRKT